MSRTPLFDRLVDDAAVFPPGLAPVDVAVRDHLALREGAYAAELGPLLVPATAVAQVVEVLSGETRAAAAPLSLGLIVRPGATLQPLAEAAASLRETKRAVVAGVEVGWADGWRAALELGVPVAVEVGLGRDQEAGLEDIAAAVDDDHDVTAKFRTGPTDTWRWPDEAALAGFIDATVLQGLSFKLTGGLHHVVRGTYDGQPMHGLLNVLVAVREAVDGAEAPELAEILALTDAEALTERVAALTAVDASRVRKTFASYGCCGVLDPLTELEALGLVTPAN